MKLCNTVISNIKCISPFANKFSMNIQSRRYYSSSSNEDYNSTLVPIFTINNLSNDSAKLFKDRLKNKAGIYSFVNTINGKQYR